MVRFEARGREIYEFDFLKNKPLCLGTLSQSLNTVLMRKYSHVFPIRVAAPLEEAESAGDASVVSEIALHSAVHPVNAFEATEEDLFLDSPVCADVDTFKNPQDVAQEADSEAAEEEAFLGSPVCADSDFHKAQQDVAPEADSVGSNHHEAEGFCMDAGSGDSSESDLPDNDDCFEGEYAADGDFLPVDHDGHATFEQHVLGLLAAYDKSLEEVEAFLRQLPLYAPSLHRLGPRAMLRRFSIGIDSLQHGSFDCTHAIDVEIPMWRTIVYPLAVLFSALSRCTSMPTVFYLDSFIALLSSVLHKDIAVRVAGFMSRARFWCSSTQEPGAGKSPALDPLRNLLFEVMASDPTFAPGSASTRFHMQQGTTHARALNRLASSSGYLLIASAEAGPLLCPTWPTNGTWNQSTHIDYSRFLDAANGGPVPWETMKDVQAAPKQSAAKVRPDAKEADDFLDAEDTPATGGFASTNVTIVVLQQISVFSKWWAVAESSRHVGFGARFLHAFGCSKLPGPTKHADFADKVVFPILKCLFALVLKRFGPVAPMGDDNDLTTWAFTPSDNKYIRQLRLIAKDKIATSGGRRMLIDGLNKTSYWIAQVTLYNSLLQQLLPLAFANFRETNALEKLCVNTDFSPASPGTR